MLTSIVAAVVILAVLIVVHEAGHFVMAKRCGVRVLRFSIGYPPKLWGIRRGETEYAISATPLGGYVRMLGDEVGDEPGLGDTETLLKETVLDLIESAKLRGQTKGPDPENELVELAHSMAAGKTSDKSVPMLKFGRELTPLESALLSEIDQRSSVQEAVSALAAARPPALVETVTARSFPTQSVGKRILIVVAGPLANFLFAPVALAVVLMYGIPRLLPVIGQIKQGLPAATAGLHTGDRVLFIDGHPVKTWDDLSDTVKSSDGRQLTIDFLRDGQRRSLILTPTRDTHSGLGESAVWIIGVLPRGDKTVQQLGPMAAAERGVIETGRMTGMLVTGIAQIVRGTTPIREALGGPIMIAQIAGQEAHQGFASIALFTVMLSIELAIINLFPVPLLDGGHLAFFLVECVRGKPLAVRHREMAQRVGLVVLVALMAFVIFNDISRIVQG